MKERFPLELEMVPEPGNRWDKSAVAFNVDGQRIGYLPAEMAPAWLPYVTAKRNEGIAIFVPALISNGCRIAIKIPGRRTLAQLAVAAGLGIVDTSLRTTRVYY
jgi:hypothetical protein